MAPRCNSNRLSPDNVRRKGLAGIRPSFDAVHRAIRGFDWNVDQRSFMRLACFAKRILPRFITGSAVGQKLTFRTGDSRPAAIVVALIGAVSIVTIPLSAHATHQPPVGGDIRWEERQAG